MAGVLVACVGNIFLSDDGFGVSVAAALSRAPVPDGVTVVAVGFRSVHLVYELLEGYDVLVVVDTMTMFDLATAGPVMDGSRPASASHRSTASRAITKVCLPEVYAARSIQAHQSIVNVPDSPLRRAATRCIMASARPTPRRH